MARRLSGEKSGDGDPVAESRQAIPWKTFPGAADCVVLYLFNSSCILVWGQRVASTAYAGAAPARPSVPGTLQDAPCGQCSQVPFHALFHLMEGSKQGGIGPVSTPAARHAAGRPGGRGKRMVPMRSMKNVEGTAACVRVIVLFTVDTSSINLRKADSISGPHPATARRPIRGAHRTPPTLVE